MPEVHHDKDGIWLIYDARLGRCVERLPIEFAWRLVADLQKAIKAETERPKKRTGILATLWRTLRRMK